MTKNVTAKTLTTSAWGDGTRRSAPEPGGSIRWNPGKYLGCGQVGRVGSDQVSAMLAEAATIEGVSQIKGYSARFAWALLEPTKGNYDFDAIWDVRDYLASIGKKLILEIWDVKFSNNPTNYIPSYLSSETDAAGGWTVTSSATKANWYKSSIMDRWIALHEAIAAEFADDSVLEGLHTSETSFDYSGASGYSFSAERTQLQRFWAALKDAFPNCNVWANINYINGGEANTETMVADVYAAGIGIGGPDTFGATATDNYGIASGLTWGQLAYIGKTWNGSAWVDGGTDYRGLMPAAFQVQEPEMLGYQFTNIGAPFTIADIYETSNDVLENNHTCWAYTSSDPTYATDTLLPALSSSSYTTVSGCPAVYDGACSVG